MSAKRDRNSLVLGGEPRADLLPPEIHLTAAARATRRMLSLIVVLVLVAATGAYIAAAAHAASAQVALDAAHSNTLSLLDEQKKYQAASVIAHQATSVQAGLTQAASTEVLWPDVIANIERLLPSGTTLDTAALLGRSPWDPELSLAGPLRQPHVASLALVLKSTSLSDITAAVAALSALPGMVDMSLDTVTAKSDGYYAAVSVDLGATSLSGRFPASGTAASK